LVLDVGPDLHVLRRGEPDARVAAFVTQVPHAALEPGGGRTLGARLDWLAVLFAHVELPDTLPRDPVHRSQQLRLVALPLCEHVVRSLVPDDHHVLDPVVAVGGALVVARPLDPVGTGGVAELQKRATVALEAGLPHAVKAALAHDPAALADADVSAARAGPGECRFLGI